MLTAELLSPSSVLCYRNESGGPKVCVFEVPPHRFTNFKTPQQHLEASNLTIPKAGGSYSYPCIMVWYGSAVQWTWLKKGWVWVWRNCSHLFPETSQRVGKRGGLEVWSLRVPLISKRQVTNYDQGHSDKEMGASVHASLVWFIHEHRSQAKPHDAGEFICSMIQLIYRKVPPYPRSLPGTGVIARNQTDKNVFLSDSSPQSGDR